MCLMHENAKGGLVRAKVGRTRTVIFSTSAMKASLRWLLRKP